MTLQMASFSNLSSRDRAKVDQKLAELRARTGRVWECFVMRPPQGRNLPCLLEITIDGRSAKPIVLKDDEANPADCLCRELENHVSEIATATTKCGFGPCDCRSEAGRPYCSQDCEGAANQGSERDVCQCAHGNCTSTLANQFKQPGVLGTSPTGQITIDYTDHDNLLVQLMDLASALLAGKQEVLTPLISAGSNRRPSSSETAGELASSQTA